MSVIACQPIVTLITHPLLEVGFGIVVVFLNGVLGALEMLLLRLLFITSGQLAKLSIELLNGLLGFLFELT